MTWNGSGGEYVSYVTQKEEILDRHARGETVEEIAAAIDSKSTAWIQRIIDSSEQADGLDIGGEA